MALEEELTLEISQALQAIGQVEDALTTIADNFKTALEDSFQNLSIPDVTVPVDTSQVDSLEQTLGALSGDVTISTENPELPAEEVQTALDAAHFQVTPEVDVEGLTSQLDDAFGQAADAASGIDLGDQLGPADQQIQDTTGHALELGGALSVVRSAAGATSREFEPLTEHVTSLSPALGGAAAAVGAFAVAGHELIGSARDSVSATQRFNLILGDMAEQVDNINIGGLNEDLTHLAQRLGQDDEALRNAASKVFQIGSTSGIARPQVAQLTETVVALAARAGALDPTLSNVGASAQRLFFGLARGGPILARFGIDLPAKELRDFAEQEGKTFAALSIGERATIGAQLAMQKLGGTLATDINNGAQNVEIRFRALSEQFKNTVEDLGAPLLEPVLQAIRDGQPLLLDLVKIFAQIIEAVLPLADVLVKSLAPAVLTVTTALTPLASLLKIVTDLISLIPADILGAAAAFGVAALAAEKFGVALKVAAVAEGESAFAGLAKSLQVSSVSLGISFAAITVGLATAQKLWSKMMADAQQDADAFVDNQKKKLPEATTTVAQLTEGIHAMQIQTEELRKSADKSKSPFDIDYRRSLRDAAKGLDDVTKEYQDQIIQAENLSLQTGVSSDKLLQLIRTGQDLSPVLARANTEYKNFFQTLQSQALDELIFKQSQGAISADAFAQAVTDTGKSTKELDGILQQAAQNTATFVQNFGSPTPSVIDTAVGKIDKATLSLKNFETEVQKQGFAQLSFQANLQKLFDAGAFDAFEAVQKLGPEKGALILQQAVDGLNGGITHLQAVVAQGDAITAQGEAQRTAAAEAAAKRLALVEEVKVKFGFDISNLDESEKQFISQLVNDANSPGGIGDLFGTAVGNSTKEAMQRSLQESDDKTVQVFNAIGVLAAAQFDNGFTQFRDSRGALTVITEADKQVAFDEAKGLGELVVGGYTAGISLGGASADVSAETKKSLVDPVLDTIHKLFKISSPSLVMKDLGQQVIDGFNAGLADTSGAEKLVTDLLAQINRLHLGIKDLSSVSGDSFEALTKSIDDVAKARDDALASPDALKQIGDAVKALGGPDGVKKLQDAMAMQVSKAFGGLSADTIKEIADQIQQQRAVQLVSAAVGVTPTPTFPTEGTASLFGTDNATATPTAPTVIIQELNATVPPDATAPELGAAISDQVTWALRSVTK